MLITTHQLHPDGILQLTIHPPEGADCDTLQMGLKVLWCSPANTPAEYWVGLETIDISAANLASLNRLLSHVGSEV